MPSRAAARDRAPVMADVARIAGVSHQTVSRVLNDHPNVRSQTRDRVLAAIRELDFRPNAAARTLVTRRTNTLGVISFNTTLYGPASMLYGIEQAAKQHDYFVTVAALDRRSVLDAVERLRDQSVEGIIVIAPQTTAVAALASVPKDVPLVAVGCGPHAGICSVAVDNEAGAHRAVSYLLDLGHRTVHHLAGPRTWLDAQEREAGWRRALVERGLPVPAALAGGDWAARTGFELGGRMATRPHEVYRALLEATAFGTRVIIEAFEGSGVPVTEFVVAGGMLKNSLLRQIYADVTRRPLSLIGSDQGPALGAAIHAAVAAGAYPDVPAAARVMGKLDRAAYTPDPDRAAAYDALFAEYRRLYDYFGRGGNDVLHRLRAIRQAALAGGSEQKEDE